MTSLALAVLSAITGRNSATRQVDNRLLALRAVVTQEGVDPVDSLLRSLQTLPTNFVAALAVDDEAVIDLIAADNPDSLQLDSLERDVLMAAVASPQTVAGREPIRISAIDLGTGDLLVFGEGIGDITGAFANQLLINCAIAVVVAVLGGLVTHQFTRRSLAPLGDIIKYSQTVAAGRLDANLPTDAHTDEVRELQSNISSMVGELQNAVNIKSRSEQQMREFLADVAHELRTPLTTVRAYADVLASQQSVEPE
ncbi:MAG: histidine kinase dimerization/phospho-acceptor domain-containing protein, partial [Ilumatobacteraceae bacterium]